jgi:cytochrome c oxidase cbb3-type subunit I/II
MMKPTLMSPGSLMPNYPWLLDNDLDTSLTASKIKAMRTLGVPYEEGYESIAVSDLNKQASAIAEGLKKDKINTAPNKEIIALIAYLQRLGTDIKAAGQQGVTMK